MRRGARIAAVAGTVVFVGVVAMAFRSLTALGVLASDPEPVKLACHMISGVTGAQDFAIDRKANLLFISAANARKPDTADGLYVLHLDEANARPERMAGSPKDFHPHGISLFVAPDGSRTLMAIHHPKPDESGVEVFDVVNAKGGVALKSRTSIDSSLLSHANDIVAVDPERFYATNQTGSGTGFGKMMEMFAIWPRGSVVYFDGRMFRPGASGLSFPTGIAASADGTTVYVSELLGRKITLFTREPYSGTLTKSGEIAISGGPDKIDVDGATLWTTAHPKPMQLQSAMAHPKQASPSDVWRVDGTTPTLVYANDGKPFSAAAAAVSANGHLYVGSVFDSGILDCTLPH